MWHIVLLEPISLDALEKSTGRLQVRERTLCALYMDSWHLTL